MEKYQEVERSIITKFRPTIWRLFLRGIEEYKLIEENDKIAVCISGGKDSMLLAKCMQELLAHGNIKFEVCFIAMDPGYNLENRRLLEDNAKLLNVPLTFFNTKIFDVVNKTDDSPCYLCARMRRGHLYSMAKQMGCNKIALGHHFDDVIETILMGMFYGSQVQTMMPKLHSTNFDGMELIRPLYLVKEKDIAKMDTDPNNTLETYNYWLDTLKWLHQYIGFRIPLSNYMQQAPAITNPLNAGSKVVLYGTFTYNSSYVDEGKRTNNAPHGYDILVDNFLSVH